MPEPFLGEIRLMSFNYAPEGWARCDGQLLSISENQSLYLLLGTTYGGDGKITFALPDLQGRVPMHRSKKGTEPDHAQGQRGGQEKHTLSVPEMPEHHHAVHGTSNTVRETIPAVTLLPGENAGEPYSAGANGTLGPCLLLAGTDSGHENMQPWLAVEFCIAIRGTFPPRH
ncbi:MAG: tail fiber protein [Pseudomonadota bacterium]